MKRRKVSAFLVLVMLIGLLAGCGGTDNGNSGEAETNIAYYSLNSDPIYNWDPSIMSSNGTTVLNNVYEQLLRFNPETKEFEYLLATDYSHSEDGLTWTFKLREGVKFHDGTDFNAEAVKFSIDRTMEKGQGASYIWEPVEKIKVVDEYTVEFNLSYSAPLDLIVSGPYAAYIMSPTAVKNNDDNWFEQGNEAGTGPYMLESNSMGDEVILTQYKDYWKGWEGEHFEKVILKKNVEASSRRQLLEKGEIDITTNMTSEDLDALKENEDIIVSVKESLTTMYAFFNTQKAPLDNPKVRKALSYAFPYEDAVQFAAGGYAEQARGVIPKSMWGYSKDLFQFTKDLDKAKDLLKEAGIKEGELNLVLTYITADEAEKKTAELYKAELSKIGVELELRGMPWESQWEMAMGPIENRQDIYMMYWWPDIATPNSWLLPLFHTEESTLFNLSYYKNNEFDMLIDDANRMSGIDINAAEAGFIKAQEILLEDNPAVFIYDKHDAYVLNSTFKGFEINPFYPLVVFFYNCYRE